MKEKDAKNTVDNTPPAADAVRHLSEEEKKALEISGQIEHAHGRRRNDLASQARELDEKAKNS